jgi:hypothetical protein
MNEVEIQLGSEDVYVAPEGGEGADVEGVAHSTGSESESDDSSSTESDDITVGARVSAPLSPLEVETCKRKTSDEADRIIFQKLRLAARSHRFGVLCSIGSSSQELDPSVVSVRRNVIPVSESPAAMGTESLVSASVSLVRCFSVIC